MKYLSILLLCASFAGYAEDKVCPKCEMIREYNKTHHKNYEYYEDYIKDEQGGSKKAESSSNADQQPKPVQRTTKPQSPSW